MTRVGFFQDSVVGYLAQSKQIKGPGPWTGDPGSRTLRADTGPLVLESWIHWARVLFGVHFYSRLNFKLNRAAGLAEWRSLVIS